MEVDLMALALLVLVLAVQGLMQERRLKQLAQKVERLEQRSMSFLPASYAYLNDLEAWTRRKERSCLGKEATS
jgi:hypothetical protein